MKKAVSFMIVLALMLSLCACDAYTSSYKAIGLVRSQTSHSCEASFLSLEGRLVFKIKKENGTEGAVHYSVRVDEGEVHLYYDIYGTKEELAHVKAGEPAESSGGYVEGGKTVYIIIEAAKGSRGKVRATLEA